ncbi:MAG: hypothetical protein AAF798_00845 [Bacteroidota bacterium]
MDISTQKLRLIEAILQCHDPKVLGAVQSVLALQAPQVDQLAANPPWIQAQQASSDNQNAGNSENLQQLQDDIDSVFNAF